MIDRFKKIQILFPFLLLAVTAAIIFYKFPILPHNLAYDEVYFSQLALSLNHKPYIPYSPLATGHSTLYFYIILLSFKLLGITPLALRLPSAIAGVLCVLLLYLIMRNMTKNSLVAFVMAFILATSRWFIDFSRFAFEPVFLMALELFSIYFLYVYLKRKEKFYLILTGMFAGFAFNSYTPGRIFFLLPLGFLVLFLKKQKRSAVFDVQTFEPLLYILIPFIIFITPLQSYLLIHKDIRVNELFFLSNPKLSVQQKAAFLGENIVSAFSMLVYKGDSNGKDNYPYKPALNPIIIVLVIAGFYFALRSKEKSNSVFFFSYFLLSIIPSILVYPWENPSMLRTYTTLPALAYFAGLPLYYVLKSTYAVKKLIPFAVVFIILISSAYELRTYFFYQTQVFPSAFEIKKPLDYVIRCPDVLECNK